MARKGLQRGAGVASVGSGAGVGGGPERVALPSGWPPAAAAPTSGFEGEAHAQALGLVGETLRGKWHLDALVGVGGMAAVYAATHRNGHRAAIKLLHRAFALSASVRERFLREGYAANGVDHPGVVRVLDDDELDDGRVFLVMELLNGETLDGRWKRRGCRLGAAEVLAVADELLCVLACAHARGITHRDIKPENVFLTDEGKLKVLDFGIARLRDSLVTSVTKTQTGVALGTPAFMAPEQARGRSREVDGRSDLWSVGATLFTLLTGEYVHATDSSNEMLILAATERARPLAAAWPGAPADLAEVVDRALAFDRADRWPDAPAMRRAVRTAQASLGLTQGASLGAGPLASAGALFVEGPTVVKPVDDPAPRGRRPSFAPPPPSTAPAAITFIPSMSQIRGRRHRAPHIMGAAALAIAGAVGPYVVHASRESAGAATGGVEHGCVNVTSPTAEVRPAGLVGGEPEGAADANAAAAGVASTAPPVEGVRATHRTARKR